MGSSDKFNTCRLCLRDSVSLIDLFEETNERRCSIKEAIEDLLHFKFDIVDMKTELLEVQEEASPQVARISPIQTEQEEEMMSDRASMEMDSMPCCSERGVTDPRLGFEGFAADFWRATEAALEIKIPKYLKHILKMNGFDNGLSMANFTAGSLVPVLERFVREDMPYVIPADCLREDYYGIFERCPERFRIVWGHVNILVKMAEYWKESRKLSRAIQKNNECSFADEVGLNPQPFENQGQLLDQDWCKEAIQDKTVSLSDTKSDSQMQKDFPKIRICQHSSGVPNAMKTCLKHGESSDIGSEKVDESEECGPSYWKREKDHLVSVIKESLSEKVSDYNENIKLAVNDLHGQHVITKFRLLADVQCFLCTISIRTYRVCSEYNMSKWMVSNYVRHVVEQHCVGGKKNKKKSVSLSETSANSVSDHSAQDNQHSSHSRENVLGCTALEDYCAEDSHPRISLFSDETPSKKKRSVESKECDACES
ncbi:uncharacterized protein LOC124159239 isoform X2 [Ischnura elegans]|uniref:uncharacterized protein LOC124159239 isoform X2 n=1 Tax=Ischnura elegans TaxID=197161 RepID=UPI001ED8AAA1|nr:uncharacterized protein LOC124159239 isoform X2 [Ischnura elegans]